MNIPSPQQIERLTRMDYKTENIVLTMDIFFRIFGLNMILPKGFRSDGNSFPFFIRAFVSKFNAKVLFAGMVHDYIYRTQFVPRDIGDAIYREILFETHSKTVGYLAYWALRLFGGIAWYNNKKKLEQYPKAKERLAAFTLSEYKKII